MMRIFESVRIYLDFTKANIRATMALRSSFWLGVAGQWLGYGASVATMYILIRRFETIDGWTATQVMFLFAMNLLSYALAATVLFTPCVRLVQKIRTGEFDASLTKPLQPLFHEICLGFNSGYFSHITLSVVMIVYSIYMSGATIHLRFIATFFLMLVGSTLIQGALLIIASSFSFVLKNHNPLFEFIWEVKEFIKYPISIFGVAVQVLLTILLPVGFINYYPARLLFSNSAVGWLTPVIGVALLLLSRKMWYWMLTKYQSSGS